MQVVSNWVACFLDNTEYDAKQSYYREVIVQSFDEWSTFCSIVGLQLTIKDLLSLYGIVFSKHYHADDTRCLHLSRANRP